MAALAEATPVPIHQWETEFFQLLKIYRKLAPKKVLEIGSYDGGTYYHFLTNAEPPALVVSVDLYEGEFFIDPEHDNRELYPSWTPKGVTQKTIAASSTAPETKKKLRALGPFDFAFIDGDHSYAVVLSDYELCLELVRPGGIIALHDIVPPPQPVPWMEVDALWREILESGVKTKAIVATNYQTWGGIGVVYV